MIFVEVAVAGWLLQMFGVVCYADSFEVYFWDLFKITYIDSFKRSFPDSLKSIYLDDFKTTHPDSL